MLSKQMRKWFIILQVLDYLLFERVVHSQWLQMNSSIIGR